MWCLDWGEGEVDGVVVLSVMQLTSSAIECRDKTLFYLMRCRIVDLCVGVSLLRLTSVFLTVSGFLVIWRYLPR